MRKYSIRKNQKTTSQRSFHLSLLTCLLTWWSAKPTKRRQFERGTTNVESDNGTEEVNFDAFDPSDRHAEVTRERRVETGARRGDADPSASIGIILADGRRR